MNYIQFSAILLATNARSRLAVGFDDALCVVLYERALHYRFRWYLPTDQVRICRLFFPLQRGHHPLQMPITLHPPNLSRHSLPLGILQTRITEPGGLGLDSPITHSSDRSTGQLSQTGYIIGQFFDQSRLELGPAFLIRFGFCGSVLFRHIEQITF
ncbi:MAG: hypothetical protein AB1801_10055 [Chloroflexota bacterium]